MSAACLRAQEADSWGSSVVWYVEHVIGIYVQSDWGEQSCYQKMKVYRLYVAEACRNHVKSPGRKVSLKWPCYAEKVTVPRKWGLHTMSIFLAHGDERYNHLPEVDLQNPWLQAASLPTRSCGTFRSFLARIFQLFDTYNFIILIVILNKLRLTSNSVPVPHSLHWHAKYASNAWISFSILWVQTHGVGQR